MFAIRRASSIAQGRVLERGSAEARSKGKTLLARIGLADKVDEYPDASSAASSSASRSLGASPERQP
jgi:ABC-type polar amino acid transport system ATPase subunit